MEGGDGEQGLEAEQDKGRVREKYDERLIFLRREMADVQTVFRCSKAELEEWRKTKKKMTLQYAVPT